MAYHKSTVISGYTGPKPSEALRLRALRDNTAHAEWQRQFEAVHKVLVLRGHWSLAAANRRARRSGMIGSVEVTHSVADTSGRGRSGHDGRWLIDEAGSSVLTDAPR